MSKVFRITPKRTKRSNGQVLTPDMSICESMVSTTRKHAAPQMILNLRSWTKLRQLI